MLTVFVFVFVSVCACVFCMCMCDAEVWASVIVEGSGRGRFAEVTIRWVRAATWPRNQWDRTVHSEIFIHKKSTLHS